MKFTLPKIPQSTRNNTKLSLEKLRQLHNQAYDNANYAQALEYALQGHRLAPKVAAPLQDAMLSAIMAKQWQIAVDCALKILKITPNNQNALDGLSHAYYELGEHHKAKEYGLKALNLLDSGIKLQELPFNAPRSGKKIIAFSLYGNNPKYLEPAVINAEISSLIYPDWVCRFYVDESVPQHTIQRLTSQNAEIIFADSEMKKMPATMWRFLALDDESVSSVIFRDADSVISQREAKAVNAWLNSGKPFHTLRDHGAHTELVLAGMWGAHCGYLPHMQTLIMQYVNNTKLDKRFADQYFLRQHIWGFIRDHLYAHDSLFGFLNAQPFPSDLDGIEKRMNVGMTESIGSFNAKGELPDGSKIRWQLFSKIQPLVNEDLSYSVAENERLICEYEYEVYNKTISALIPQRYYQGFKTGESRIAIQVLSY